MLDAPLSRENSLSDPSPLMVRLLTSGMEITFTQQQQFLAGVCYNKRQTLLLFNKYVFVPMLLLRHITSRLKHL